MNYLKKHYMEMKNTTKRHGTSFIAGVVEQTKTNIQSSGWKWKHIMNELQNKTLFFFSVQLTK